MYKSKRQKYNKVKIIVLKSCRNMEKADDRGIMEKMTSELSLERLYEFCSDEKAGEYFKEIMHKLVVGEEQVSGPLWGMENEGGKINKDQIIMP